MIASGPLRKLGPRGDGEAQAQDSFACDDLDETIVW
jgi:hypothetical protein